jgi:hypothetical protein
MNYKICDTEISNGLPCESPGKCPNKKVCRINQVKCSCYKDGECIEIWTFCEYQKPEERDDESIRIIALYKA